MAEALLAHLQAVTKFLSQLNGTPALGKVAAAQHMHVEQVVQSTAFTVEEASQVLGTPSGHFRISFGSVWGCRLSSLQGESLRNRSGQLLPFRRVL